MENVAVKKRLSILRDKLKEYGIDYYMMPTSDFHNSEYAADFFKAREYFTGFTGSNGTVLVSKDWAGLWTDGRYFIQAEKEIEGTGVTLYRMGNEGVPTLSEYLKDNMKKGQVLGFDGRVISTSIGLSLEQSLKDNEVSFSYERDLAGEVWNDRPALPCHEIYKLKDELFGKSFKEKLSDVRSKMAEYKCDSHFLSKLDDIAWLLNLRGNDVECNPVALSYLFITMDEIHFFVQEAELSDKIRDYCKDNDITINGYHDVMDFLKNKKYTGSILVDKNNMNYATYKALLETAGEEKLVYKDNPTELMKAVKNETEIKNIRQIYLRDSAKLCEFMYYVKTNVGKIPMTEYSVAQKLDSMRAELPGFIELSFGTISAYGPNAAMMHYEATETDHAKIEPKGMLLVDSGGTYEGGTTDVTRTMVLGPISDEIKKHYTGTCISMLHLANAKFLKGCTGRNLDILAREPLWAMDIDYKCGTGHGIGYMLNVHEGPHSIRWQYREGMKEYELVPGMIVSDEPGVYKEGSHGIRIENIIEVVEDTKNSDGQFLSFNFLTYAPIDLEAIDTQYMQQGDIDLLNAYHKAVFEKVSPLIEDQAIVEWLRNETRPISK